MSDEYTDTPETDNLEISMDEQDYVPGDKLRPYADLCRKLERERDGYKRQRDEMTKQFNKAMAENLELRKNGEMNRNREEVS